MNLVFKLGCGFSLAIFLAACGGGGGGGEASTPAAGLSTTQKNFESAAINDSYVVYNWKLPSTNVVPVTGTNFMYVSNISVPSSPSSGAVVEARVASNYTASLALPNLTQSGVVRVLKSGVIYVGNETARSEWSYFGGDVLSTGFAVDGVTPLQTTVYDSWSAPVALTGQISGSTILKSFLGFTKATSQTVNFDFSQSWLSGSSYFTRKGYDRDDTLFLYDWTGTTYSSAVNPYPGTETTIETMFANASFVAVGGLTVDSVVYPLAAGTISSYQGARVWIANAKRPTSASPTNTYVAYIELNGKIYPGIFEKAGTRFNYIDGVDSTIVNDYNIRLNSHAAASMKTAIKF